MRALGRKAPYAARTAALAARRSLTSCRCCGLLRWASAIASSSVSTAPRVVSATCAIADTGKRALASATATSTVDRIGGKPREEGRLSVRGGQAAGFRVRSRGYEGAKTRTNAQNRGPTQKRPARAG